MGEAGFEPAMSRRIRGLQPRAISLSATHPSAKDWQSFARTGGNGRHRTGNPLLARQVLSQLSYVPDDLIRSLGSHIGMAADNLPQPGLCLELMAPQRKHLVGADGLDPPTYCL